VKTGPYKHPARLTQFQNGDFYLVYYGGEGEYANDTAVFGSRLKKGENRWSPPRVIASDPFRSLGNGVIWQSPDGKVWLFYVVRFGETWSSSRVQAKVSKDNAETWSDAFPLHLEEGMMVCNKPIVLNNGNYLLPLYHETGADKEKVGADSTGLFLRFDATKKQWSETGRIRSATGNIQPAVVQLTDDHLVAYCRRGGDYEPTTHGYLVRAESQDGGQTWSEGKNSQFPNPNAAVDFLKLRNGHLLLIYNDSMNDRTPLTAAISTDNDKTYPHRRNIATGDFDYAYPIATQALDGKIHVLYTSHGRTVVNRAVFDEEWVLESKTPTR
jgi:predicted neuraminidase